MPRVGSTYTCLEATSIDSILKKDETYYLQIFSKECRHFQKEKKVIKYISDDLELFWVIMMSMINNNFSLIHTLKCFKLFNWKSLHSIKVSTLNKSVHTVY